ncbi:MAG: efflux RND transporter periplasmic adaptor subunit [Spirochaetales bacterium]|nr:efflux RND transporter periplasmic adaptor subunit [Spirochaetales bacterium]
MFILISILILSGCGGSESDEVTGATWDEALPEQLPLTVDARETVKGSLVPWIETSGIIEGTQEGVVVSQTQGIITETYGEIGIELKAGDPLLKVDDSVALLNLQQAREQMENAKITLDVNERLASGGGASQAELLRARSSYRGAQALFEIALKSYEDTTLKSPIDGVLAWKAGELETGNYLSAGQPVYRIADLSGVKVSISLGERQIGLIKTGLDAEIDIPSAIGTDVLKGKVTAVAAASEMSTGSYLVIIQAENPESSGIRAGMSASVKVFTHDPRQGIIIPASSVVNREGKSYVFVEEDGLAVPKEITAGESLGNRLIISTGLEAGVEIITTGLSVLKPGDPVSIVVRGTSEEGI